jgi:hypothetical protein
MGYLRRHPTLHRDITRLCLRRLPGGRWEDESFSEARPVRRLDETLVQIWPRMCRRRPSWLPRPSERALDGVELGLALDGEQRDLATAARLALERATIDRRPVGFGRLEKAEGDHPVMPERAYRQQREAAAAASDRARRVSGNGDHGRRLDRRRHDLQRGCRAPRMRMQGCWHCWQMTSALVGGCRNCGSLRRPDRLEQPPLAGGLRPQRRQRAQREC